MHDLEVRLVTGYFQQKKKKIFFVFIIFMEVV